MSDIILTNHTCSSMTVISNLFLDTYLPKASGEAIKVYLLLLRYAGAGQSITLSILAKKLNQTEEAIRDALSYWEKMGLLHITLDQMQTILSMQLLPIPMGDSSKIEKKEEEKSPLCRPISEVIQATGKEKEENYFEHKKLPEKKSITPYELDHYPKADSISQILFITERYFEKQLTVTDINTIFYIYDSLKFSDELLEYLIEYCTSIDKKSIRYAETVAIRWYEQGIKTVKQAKESTKNYNKIYNSIVKAFGISRRNLGSVEINYIDTWFKEYGFSLSIVLEACDRTLKTIYQPSFKYANKILMDWKEAGAMSMEEITKLDAARKSGKKQSSDRGRANLAHKPATNNKFHNFEQRTYNYQELEQKFINKANGIQKEGN